MDSADPSPDIHGSPSDDSSLARQKYEPMLARLNGGKAVYRERFVRWVAIRDFQADAAGFRAVAVPLQTIRGIGYECDYGWQPWDFGSDWAGLRELSNGSLNVPYAGWSLWTDPALLARIEILLAQNPADHRQIVRLLSPPEPPQYGPRAPVEKDWRKIQERMEETRRARGLPPRP